MRNRQTGDRRFRLPEPIPPYTGTVQATASGPSCPQQSAHLPLPEGLPSDIVDLIANTAYKAIFPESEDCLSINVIVPSTATPTSKLPVAVWIFGGGFELGSPNMYDGGPIVERSIQLGEPVIYVSMNYRLNAFGFLASQEVKDAGLGISGSKTLGESAGAISAALHMVANDGNHEGLFRGAFMQSGSPIPVGDITHGQVYYDAIAAETGCSSASDTLACLRSVPYATLKTAVDHTPFIFDYQQISMSRMVSPHITGTIANADGLFSTNAQFRTYIKTFYMPQSTDAELDQIMNLYPSDITKGSPFGTGILNVLSPQFKRLAAFQGDAVFQAPRRFFLEQRSGKQSTWSFLSKRLKGIPLLGSFHFSDILNVYFGGEMEDYLINFVNKLDPNGEGRGINWPKLYGVSLVASLGILATAEIVILSFGIYHKIVDPFTPSQTLNVESIRYFYLRGGISLMAFIAQLFFASRIWIVSSSRWLYAGPIVILALTQFGVALAQVITEANLDGINLFWSSVRFMSVQTGTTALADILSSIGLCYTLQSSRSGISRTDAVIGKLMKYSIHRAIATTAAAVLTVALLVSISQTTAFMIPLLVSGQLYVISVVSMLLHRSKLRDLLHDRSDHLLTLPSSSRITS
ncbi:hypothetical protein EYR40_003229 [Pleurotus pulmonarius]|nr:hypothetical protein EYR40_003229 [Pleurotus pulmonarius]